MKIQKDWQSSLKIWLQYNSKTIPIELQNLRKSFIQRFPMETLKDLTLEQYAVGKPDSFCYWLEFKTKELGSISGGSAAKFGVWWSKSEDCWRRNSMYQDENDALEHIKQGLLALIDATKAQDFVRLDRIGDMLLGPQRYSMRAKPLYLYFPELFLPVANPNHLKYFLNCIGENPQGDLMTLNRQLLAALQSHPEFTGFDTYQMMVFFYESMPPQKGDIALPKPQKTKLSDSITLPTNSHTKAVISPSHENKDDVVVAPINSRTKVFISYSHENKAEMDRLLVHLKAARLNKKVIDWWDDTQIKPGEKGQDELRKAISSTYIAVLLISIDYLASEVILKDELLPLLTAAEEEGVTILPVILGPCSFKYTELAHFQPVNDPDKPLSKLPRHEVDEVWNKVVVALLNPDNA